MINPHEKVERSLFKIALITVTIFVVLIAGGIYGYKQFRGWQQRRLVAQGNAFFAQGDYKRASLNARRILQINPDNVQGERLMARLAEKAGSATAVEWWRRLMDASVADTDDLIHLARAAIRFEDRPTADAAMSKLPANAKERPEYHALMADLAYSRRDGEEMSRELSEAIRLDPQNKEYVIRRAALQLTAADAAIRQQGRETLVQLQSDPKLHDDATRHLAEAALRERSFTSALDLARQLDSSPNRTFADRLLLLGGLKGTNNAAFAPTLEQAEAAATNDHDNAAALISWLNVNGMAREAIAWSAKLPPDVLTGRLVPVALSDSYLLLKDWPGLQRLCKSGNWGNVDFLRSALAARAAREQGNAPDFTANWTEAKRKVTGNTRQILLLADTVGKWNWQDEAVELLWLAAKDPLKADEALRTLYAFFAKSDDAQNLYRVLLHRNELHPDDANIQNNLAQLSLLLGLSLDQGHKLAEQVYAKDAHNAAYASTYAFSLYTKGQLAKALQVMEQLTPEQREDPPVAAYYGIFLAAQHDSRAAEFLALGARARLLPQERTLLEKAQRSLSGS